MKNKRDEIIEISTTLFQKYDYNSVSMRDISNELGMSVGNLTYYFNKKEDLISAIILEQTPDPNIFIEPKNLKELHDFFLQSVENQTTKSYYFKNYNQLADINPKIYKTQLDIIESLNQTLLKGFKILQKDGFINKSLNDSNLNGIINSLVTLMIYGLSHFERTISEDPEANLLNALDTLAYLALSDKGQKIYSKYM